MESLRKRLPRDFPLILRLVHLKGLTNLRILYLNDTQFIGAGLVHLTGLTKLENLRLNGSPVTDAGLVHLKGLINLQNLGLHDTQVTVVGFVELRKALPKCNITRPTSAGRRRN